MIAAADAELLERAQELPALRAVLAEARAGRGSLTVIQAPPGQGKSALLRAARAEATEHGMRLIAARGVELERDFAFGVVRQLALPVRLGILEAPVHTAEECHARLRALYALAGRIAAKQPLAILVDDAHWSDAGSLRAMG